MPRGKTQRPKGKFFKGKFFPVNVNRAEAKSRVDLSEVCSLRHVSVGNGSEIKLVKIMDKGLFSSDSRNQYEFSEVKKKQI